MCPDCGYVAYRNPVIIVGSVASWEGRILLCRRAIAPRIGFWTLPAGFMEENETSAAGARREAWEEARARIAIDALLAIYDIARISQVQLIFRARLLDGAVEPGPESQEVGLFAWEDIPWRDLAFPTVGWALREHRTRLGRDDFAPATNPTPDVEAQWATML
jgi:ADP-ribose pyrophosphatase YjhB (NUDIX family)